MTLFDLMSDIYLVTFIGGAFASEDWEYIFKVKTGKEKL